MNIQDIWENALKNTRIVRSRAQELSTFSDTELPYIFLSEAVVNKGDTIVRTGKINVEKPAIILPSNLPQFDGFDFDKELGLGHDTFTNFLIVRGIAFPSMKYNNRTSSLEIFEGHIDKAISHHLDLLERKEDVYSGLVVGPESCWQFSVVLFVCMQVARSGNNDIRRILEQRFNNKDKTC
ncbi:MAG: hypothetical protein ABH848_06605 [Candidatus Omnitrophota bacterium]